MHFWLLLKNSNFLKSYKTYEEGCEYATYVVMVSLSIWLSFQRWPEAKI